MNAPGARIRCTARTGTNFHRGSTRPGGILTCIKSGLQAPPIMKIAGPLPRRRGCAQVVLALQGCVSLWTDKGAASGPRLPVRARN